MKKSIIFILYSIIALNLFIFNPVKVNGLHTHNQIPNKVKHFLKIRGYKIIDPNPLGIGSFSFVFKCLNAKDELVAVKVITHEYKREIQAVNNLEYIKPLNYELYKEVGDFNEGFKMRSKSYYKYLNKPKFIVISDRNKMALLEMPLIDKDIYDSILLKNEKLNFDELSKIAKSVLKALICIHNKGFVHLDIKPENIYEFHTHDGKKKYQLGDLGLLTTSSDSPEDNETHDHRRAGSLGYAAPELLDYSKQLDAAEVHKVDTYSLGKTLLLIYLNKHYNPNVEKLSRSMSQLNLAATKLEYNKLPLRSCSTSEEFFLDFIKQLLKTNPKERISASEALNHPFITESTL